MGLVIRDKRQLLLIEDSVRSYAEMPQTIPLRSRLRILNKQACNLGFTVSGPDTLELYAQC